MPGQPVEPVTRAVGQKIDTHARRIPLPQCVLEARPELLADPLAAEQSDNLFHRRRRRFEGEDVPPIQRLNQVILRRNEPLQFRHLIAPGDSL